MQVQCDTLQYAVCQIHVFNKRKQLCYYCPLFKSAVGSGACILLEIQLINAKIFCNSATIGCLTESPITNDYIAHLNLVL